MTVSPPTEKKLPIEWQHNIQYVHFSSDMLNIIAGAVEREPVCNNLYYLTLNV